MSEFFELPLATPQPNDEWLLVRGTQAYRARVSALSAGLTPPPNPTLASVWTQLDGNGHLVERWVRTLDNSDWMSERVDCVPFYGSSGLDNLAEAGNPCDGMRVYFDHLTFRAVPDRNFSGNDRWDFAVSLVDKALVDNPFVTLAVQGAVEGEVFQVEAPIQQVKAISDSLGIWVRASRQGGTPRLRMVNLCVVLRKIYDPIV